MLGSMLPSNNFDAMKVTEQIAINNWLCRLSPDGEFLATALQNRVAIRKLTDLTVIKTFSCLNPIQHLEWSSDSRFVLCAQYKSGVVQVWSLEEPEWTCKIDEGSVGLVNAQWANDGRHILTTSEFHLRITVWSLINKSVSYIKHPKSIDCNTAFTKNASYLAVAERRDCKDFISIFSIKTWQMIKHFECHTRDLGGIAWSPTENILAAWDSLLYYKVLLYTMEGQRIGSYEPYEGALGVKSVTWSPTGQFLAVGSFDQKVHILNHLTWNPIIEHLHSATISNKVVIVYKEVPYTDFSPAFGGGQGGSQYVIVSERPVQVPSMKPDANKPNPKIGVGKVMFSYDGQYLASRNDNFPTTIWIWDVFKMSLVAVIIQAENNTCMTWNPRQTCLALCSGSPKIVLWSPEGCQEAVIPMIDGFRVSHLTWNSNAESLLVIGKDKCCICYL